MQMYNNVPECPPAYSMEVGVHVYPLNLIYPTLWILFVLEQWDIHF